MPGGRAKIEGGPNQSEEDTALLIEKAILPLFAPGFTQNVTVSSTATTQHSPTALCLEPSQRLVSWCVLDHDSATIQHRPTAYPWSPVKGSCVGVCGLMTLPQINTALCFEPSQRLLSWCVNS